MVCLVNAASRPISNIQICNDIRDDGKYATIASSTIHAMSKFVKPSTIHLLVALRGKKDYKQTINCMSATKVKCYSIPKVNSARNTIKSQLLVASLANTL